MTHLDGLTEREHAEPRATLDEMALEIFLSAGAVGCVVYTGSMIQAGMAAIGRSEDVKV
jgi:hypothetical protein